MKLHYKKKQFPLPSEGTRRARLVEIKDLGTVDTPNGKKEKVRLVWELADEFDDWGDPLRVFQSFNKTLHPQSFLYKAIEDITGEEPGEEFDLDTLLGAEVDLVLKHNQGADGRTYCNVAAIFRPKTRSEEAEEKRVAAATAAVKQAAASPPQSRTRIVATKPAAATTEIGGEDIRF